MSAAWWSDQVRRAAVLIALAVTAACTPVRPPQESPGEAMTAPEVHALVLEIVARLDDLETRYGTRSDGEVSSVWRAEMGTSGAEYVEERIGRGGTGLSLVRCFFLRGRPILYQEEGERLLPAPGGSTTRETFARSILFCPSGRVVSATGQAGGRDAVPSDDAIAEARAHAAVLFARAPAGRLVHPARRPGTPPPRDLMHPEESMPRRDPPP